MSRPISGLCESRSADGPKLPGNEIVSPRGLREDSEKESRFPAANRPGSYPTVQLRRRVLGASPCGLGPSHSTHHRKFPRVSGVTPARPAQSAAPGPRSSGLPRTACPAWATSVVPTPSIVATVAQVLNPLLGGRTGVRACACACRVGVALGEPASTAGEVRLDPGRHNLDDHGR